MTSCLSVHEKISLQSAVTRVASISSSGVIRWPANQFLANLCSDFIFQRTLTEGVENILYIREGAQLYYYFRRKLSYDCWPLHIDQIGIMKGLYRFLQFSLGY